MSATQNKVRIDVDSEIRKINRSDTDCRPPAEA
jgi:hypothetical protein